MSIDSIASFVVSFAIFIVINKIYLIFQKENKNKDDLLRLERMENSGHFSSNKSVKTSGRESSCNG
uniref:Uncharacterized protein n=1 Tax=Nelumbo nucifera TaxID=4432 RepID=A0A822XV97_NELNU|nr:TPA_asm: hypothetical protein HUJ06_024554 [Nelumbo nucifera]